MDFLDALTLLKKSSEFSETSEPAHGFFVEEPGSPDQWQIGFYDKEKDHLVVYTVTPTEVEREAPQEVFKDGGTVAPLDIDAVKVSASDAISTVKQIGQDKYSGHTLTKFILLLQKLDVGQVYNVTALSNTFHLLNAKIDSATGDVLEESFGSVMDLSKE